MPNKTVEDIVYHLNEMKLSVMSKAFIEQMSDPQYQSMSFEDRLKSLVDSQWNSRQNNRLKNLIKQANFSDSTACIESIDYGSGRNLDKNLIKRLAECDYIDNHNSVIIMGATGTGKTYLACALGMAAILHRSMKVKYIRLPELLAELAISRVGGTVYSKTIPKYKEYALLIVDEWLLHDLNDIESRDLLEILEYREKCASTIFCSQFDIRGWREKIRNPIVADAVCDRIVHKSYTITIESKDSMRKLNGISNT